MKTYALYKGEKFLAEGTIKEIAEIRNVTPKTIKFYGTPTYAKRRSMSKTGNFLCLVPLD